MMPGKPWFPMPEMPNGENRPGNYHFNPSGQQNEWQPHPYPRGHKKVKCMLIGTAIVFTLVGVCLAKCCQKCKKNHKREVRNMVMRTVNNYFIIENCQ